MSTLANLLRALERSDVSEVLLKSNTVAAAGRGGAYAALTRTPLTTAQIEQIVQGTPLAAAVTKVSDKPETLDMELSAHHYTVWVQRGAEQLQVRFFRKGEKPAAGPVTPAAAVAAPAATSPAPTAAPATAAAPAEEKPTASAFADMLAKQNAAKSQAPAAPASAAAVVASIAPIAHAAAVVAAAPAPPAKVYVPSMTPLQATKYQSALREILGRARSDGASDVHIAAKAPVRVRRNGDLVPEGDPLDAHEVEMMLRSILTERHSAELERVGYADLSMNLGEAGQLRINVGRQAHGFKGCFRMVANTIPTLEGLGLPKELGDVVNYHQGLAVVSGPNGAGKTTTMAAIVDIINSHAPHHIITVEDPVEILHPTKKALISQREVGAHTKSFARALKAALREDPDVIVIGELRDKETVEIALSAAETGHLVIATMSTRSAAKTIDRLIDLFPPDEQSQVRATLAGALKIIVSQRLLPHAKGGSMVAAAELITGSVPLWNLIRDNKLFQLPSLQQRGRGLGMIRFDVSLQELVQAGKITIEVAKANAENAVELEKALNPGAAAAAAAAAAPAGGGGARAALGNLFGGGRKEG